MGRKRCCAKVGLNRGAWSPQEDEALVNYINNHGIDNWRSLPQRAGLKRCGKSCRLRWLNYLRPGIRRGNISSSEEDLIIKLHSLLGNRWALIAGRLPGRTDNEIKNYWNTTLGGKLRRRGQPLKRGPSAVRRHGKSTRKDPRTTPNPNPAPNFNPSPQPIRTKAFHCGKNTFIPTGAENQPVLERNASFISGAGSSVSSDPVDHGDFDFIAMGMDIDEELLASWDDFFQIRGDGGGGGGGGGAGIEDETPLLPPLRGELKKVACLLDLGDEWEDFVS